MMYSILTLLVAVSWLAVYIPEKRNIFSQWLKPARRRAREFLWGFTLAISLAFLTQLLIAEAGDITWSLSGTISFRKIIFSIAYDVNSVLAEELLFRGVILYFMVRYWGPRKGIALSAFAFGVYHWFSYGVLGNWVGMSLVFLMTGLMGYVFALAYEKTRSIVLPTGIHLGWNVINNTVFSSGPNGIQVLEPDKIKPSTGEFLAISVTLFLTVALLLLAFVRSGIVKDARPLTSEPVDAKQG